MDQCNINRAYPVYYNINSSDESSTIVYPMDVHQVWPYTGTYSLSVYRPQIIDRPTPFLLPSLLAKFQSSYNLTTWAMCPKGFPMMGRNSEANMNMNTYDNPRVSMPDAFIDIPAFLPEDHLSSISQKETSDDFGGHIPGYDSDQGLSQELESNRITPTNRNGMSPIMQLHSEAASRKNNMKPPELQWYQSGQGK
jgi:hypothetical protein